MVVTNMDTRMDTVLFLLNAQSNIVAGINFLLFLLFQAVRCLFFGGEGGLFLL